MKGANFVSSDVQRDRVNTSAIITASGPENISTTDGTANIANISGSERNNRTVMRLPIPFDSGDANDSILDINKENAIMSAFGKKKAIFTPGINFAQALRSIWPKEPSDKSCTVLTGRNS